MWEDPKCLDPSGVAKKTTKDVTALASQRPSEEHMEEDHECRQEGNPVEDSYRLH